MSNGSVEVVLFDLGGVLADFRGVESMQRLSGIGDEDELWRRWLTCPWVRRFERGGCTPEDFAAGVVADWELTVSPASFLDEFKGWVGGPLTGAEELVAEVRRRLPVGCLSNSNAVHWEHGGMASWPLSALFDHRFLSFELGLLKPDPEVFEHVCRQMAAEPGRVLFLDDNLLNVEAAERGGLQAARVRGVEEARSALVAAGVLEAVPD